MHHEKLTTNKIDINLTPLGSPFITFRNIRSVHAGYLFVLGGSQNKQRIFSYTALTDRFVYPRQRV
jgi:hypothetical protein